MNKVTPAPVALLDKYRGPEFQKLYTAKVRVTGGEAEDGRASGVVRSDDGNLELSLRFPEALGGPGGGTNPEQLFAAGFASCFHCALMLVAAKNSIILRDVAVDAAVSFGRDPVDGMFTLAADVRVQVKGVERAVAEQLVRGAERVCPYAKMARQGIVSVVAVHLDAN